MWLTLFFCIPAAVSQTIFSLGVTAGDAGLNQGYQPLIPQANYIQPYSSPVVPMAPYSSYPIGMGYPSSYGAGLPYGTYGYPQYPYPQIYEIHKPEGPMRRFWKGAADGVVQGSLGWLG